jgi:anti-sigma regulatory factor (Ser/Thr protein kinase)
VLDLIGSRTETRMSTTTTGRRPFRHELLLYRSAKDLVEFVVPFARDGVAAQEPTLLLLRHDTARAVVHEVGPSPYLAVECALAEPGQPSEHVRAASTLLSSYSRVVHQEPVIGRSQWPEWRRLEAVLNLALRHYETWAVCAYERRTLAADMIEDLWATHPLVGQDGEHQRNDRYQHPVNLFVRCSDDPPDHIERLPPAVELVDPSPAQARAPVKWFSRQWLPDREIDKLIFATHEALINALRHGRPPTVLRLWTQHGRVTVTVTDAGTGPIEPPAGSDPNEPSVDTLDAAATDPALGLWLIQQLVDVTRRSDRRGYTISLTARHPATPVT